MNRFEIGDLVVLTAGSMRMAVESVEGETVGCVWCHEGVIGRDRFDARLLKKWEAREEAGAGGGRAGRGERDAPGRGHGGGHVGGRGRAGGDDRPKGRTGWDGKPREKSYFRKDG
ncbi:MAG: hypothetical protein D6686_10225 [Alphaproteobacteria bacterium]|nr:MAG: hypothetical protein D6686_10225 [Alphaproteobacteria bacterium]